MTAPSDTLLTFLLKMLTVISSSRPVKTGAGLP
jgi:hypothetical protein